MIEIGTRSSHAFIDISYLQSGNAKQKEAYAALASLGIFEKLAEFAPVLAGTIPIDIDIGGSDLDIICEVLEPEVLAQILTAEFGSIEGFRITRSLTDVGIALVCNFEFGSWPVEIFAQNRPVVEQNAYKHMVIEHRILEQLGPDFHEKVRVMKRDGLKTEPAFARLLRLDGEPYQALLEMYDWNDERLHRFLEQKINQQTEVMINMNSRFERTLPLMNDRFGLFIHWGLYAIPARGEWVRSQERITNEQYQTYFEEFNPVFYDPRSWAKAAKAAGQRYAVLTTKHHDGFCLFDSELTDYKATNTPAGRDLIREYVDAFREEGLKVGFYYSLIDWYHDDYPAYGDRQHPMRDNEAFKDKTIDFDRYLDYMHGQVRELLTNYGKIDIMWFDFSYDDMTGGKWRATELIQMIRSLQPDIVIDNRLGGNIMAEDPEVYAGDFFSPEQIIPPEGIVNSAGESIPWEACITLNDHWGYHSSDRNYKSPRQVIRALVECVSKNGNLLLNVGPDAKGEIPEASLEILESVGKWLHRNGDSIYGCGIADLPKPEWGRYTQRGNKLYAHVFDRGIGPIYFQGLKGKIKKARLLADGSELHVQTPWMADQYSDTESGAFIHIDGGDLPDELDTVIELVLVEE